MKWKLITITNIFHFDSLEKRDGKPEIVYFDVMLLTTIDRETDYIWFSVSVLMPFEVFQPLLVKQQNHFSVFYFFYFFF